MADAAAVAAGQTMFCGDAMRDDMDRMTTRVGFRLLIHMNSCLISLVCPISLASKVGADVFSRRRQEVDHMLCILWPKKFGHAYRKNVDMRTMFGKPGSSR